MWVKSDESTCQLRSRGKDHFLLPLIDKLKLTDDQIAAVMGRRDRPARHAGAKALASRPAQCARLAPPVSPGKARSRVNVGVDSPDDPAQQSPMRTKADLIGLR